MGKIFATIMGLTLALASIHSYAAIQNEHYVFRYESGDTYDVKFTDNTVTWKGLEGSDKGQSETDYIKRKLIANNVEVIQWSEQNNTFVTVVFDREHLNIVSSIKTNDSNWLISGQATVG